MEDKNTGGPAFPATEVNGGTDGVGCKDGVWHYPGMTLRDYFASQALTGMQIWDAVLNDKEANFAGSKGGIPLLAKTAYEVADAMLKARDENNRSV